MTCLISPTKRWRGTGATHARDADARTASAKSSRMLDARGLFPLQDRAGRRRRGQRPQAAAAASARATWRRSTRSWPTCCTPACRCCAAWKSSNGRARNRPSSEILREVRAKVADGTSLADAMAQHPARLQRTGRQHGPRRPGRRLPRRRARAHRRLHRAPGRPEGQGHRRPGLSGLPGRRRRFSC